MANVSYPGVYIEEIAGGARPVEAASTSTAAFVGCTQMGPSDEALRITSWDQFLKHYGTFVIGSYLAQSVYQYFNNGGRQCYIARVLRPGAKTADVSVKNRASTVIDSAIKFSAKNQGEWGNYLYLDVDNGTNEPGNTFKVSVRRQEISSVIPNASDEPSPLEIFDNLSMDSDSPDFCQKVIARDSDLIRLDATDTNISIQNGFYSGYFIPLLDADVKGILGRSLNINIDQDGFQTVSLEESVFDEASTVESLRISLENTIRDLKPQRARTSLTAFEKASVEAVIQTDESDPPMVLVKFVITSGGNDGTVDTDGLDADQLKQAKRSSVRIQPVENDIAKSLGLDRAGSVIFSDAFSVRRPVNISKLQIGDHVTGGNVSGQTAGSDGTGSLGENNFEEVFKLLDTKNDFSLLAVPGVSTTGIFDAGVSYCENRPLKDVFYIGETGIAEDEPGEAEIFKDSLNKASSYGALYYPWIKASDPTGKSAEPVELPPSGYIAGLYGRIDSTRGVWKAPAGTELSLNGAVGLAYPLTDTEQGNLNRKNINAIRKFASSGIVSWGARTTSSDPEWKYVPVRRTAIMLRKSIYDGIQWAVFEPNKESLWSALRLNIGSFMNGLFRAGAFQGGKSSDAYFVRCGLGDTMTQGDIDRGQVIVLVGFAPVKPAEFVIVRIQQKVGQQ